MLHHMALSSRFMGEAVFDIELSRSAKNLGDHHQGNHVFVAGLARAGTTLLMRMLYGSGKFCSLTYRDMPFVMAPNLWSGISGGSAKSMVSQERAHGDGMLVDFDSPEALEEVFWRVFCESGYIAKTHLASMEVNAEITQKFQQYINLILLRYGGNRYLSKNNNNVLRLSSINRAFPNARVFVPFRDPLQHAGSLLSQHQRFCEQQSEDRFIRKYMGWLGHYEFGLDQRPFYYKEDGASSSPGESDFEASIVDYWIERWIDTYAHVLGQYKSGQITCTFFSYEMLCSRPDDVKRWLNEFLGIEGNGVGGLFVSASPKLEFEMKDKRLLARAEEIYIELSALSESNLC
jgi:hypothetical protein